MTEAPDTAYSGFQSFAIDDPNQRIYYLQSVYGGSLDGAVVLSYLTSDGRLNSDGRYIRLNGFGHGQALSVEVIGDETWIWMECNSLGSWFGTAICRFKWTETGPNVFDASDLATAKMPGSAVYTLRPGSTINMCYIDPDVRRLLLFYATPERNLDLYDLDEVKLKGDDAVPLTSMPMMTLQPDDEDSSIGTFQGMAFCGDYAYFLSGGTKPNTDNACLSPHAQVTHLHYQNMVDGSTGWGGSLSGRYLPRREPEGMAIQKVRGQKRLVYGYSCYSMNTEVCGGLQQLYMALFYKDRMVSG